MGRGVVLQVCLRFVIVVFPDHTHLLILIKPIPLKSKPHFKTCICQFLMKLFLPKIYDKRDDFDFEIVNFPVLDGDVPRSTSYGVYISQLSRFARVSSYVTDFNTRHKLVTQKFLKQAISILNFAKPFLNFIDDIMI